jgi:tRNA-splicing ligase RtcB
MKIFGTAEERVLQQINRCRPQNEPAALMADNHLGYSMPIGGVVAYQDKISPSGVGYDIACGNKAVLLEVDPRHVRQNISAIMDEIVANISFGVGRKNKEVVEHPLFADDPAWEIPIAAQLKDMAQAQLGTVGSGNHYVDIFEDEQERIWIGVHFGSRGLGHKIATHYVKAGGGKDGIDEPPVLLDVNSTLGQEYLACMQLAGRYAYAGRDWVCQKVSEIIGSTIREEVHNHHNFSWKEEHFGKEYWVVRKGATPAFPEQLGFVGGSMGEDSVILKGVESQEAKESLFSTVHGAGRVMGRREAAGSFKWKRYSEGGPRRKVQTKTGKISQQMLKEWITRAGVELRGGGLDEAPQCYKRLPEVLGFHGSSIEIVHTLSPLGVAMAGESEFDPYKD